MGWRGKKINIQLVLKNQFAQSLLNMLFRLLFYVLIAKHFTTENLTFAFMLDSFSLKKKKYFSLFYLFHLNKSFSLSYDHLFIFLSINTWFND